MSSSADTVGHELGEAVRLLEEAGEQIASIVRVGRARAGQTGDREVVVRQRRDECGGVELAVCHPRVAPTGLS